MAEIRVGRSSPTLEEWLTGLGLEKYAGTFAANDVDIRALPHLENADLQELGVSLGHRKVMLAAIVELREAQEASARAPPPGSQPVAPAIVSSEGGPDIRLLSVLFCDMVGSTIMSGLLSAEDMHELITAYQDAVASEVTQFGGYVAKFLGDGVLAYFGWPMAYEDHAERAIRAGLAAVASVAKLHTPAGEALQARVGIATGRVVVGDLAEGGVLERGQVAGETPNLAARLQSVAEPGQVLIAPSTRKLAGHVFEIEDLGVRELKGFSEAVPINLVRLDRRVESRFDAAHGDALSRFVGRGSEVGVLLDRWELAKSGQGQVIFLGGEAGIGKSRLIESIVAEVKAGPVELIRVQCSPYHISSAFYPVIQRLSRLAGFAASDSLSERMTKLEQLVSMYGEEAESAGPVYADLLSLDLGERFTPLDLSAQQRKELTLRTLVARPFLAAKGAPVLLVVEDAHWIDPSTSELLGEIASRIRAAPICLIVTHRPEWSAPWAAAQQNVTSVALGRLTKQQMRDLVESMLGAVGEDLLDQIAERTDGVPLFVEELTRSIKESGNVSSNTAQIPDSLQGALMARLDRLPAPLKEVAQIASVIGREFDRSLLAEVVTIGGPVLEGALRQLLSAQLVVMGGLSLQSYVFRHALVQDTAYQSLLTRKRRQYHYAIAETIICSHPKLKETQPELVARHYKEARRNDLALEHWIAAGKRALARSANYEAVEHFTEALAAAQELVEGEERGSLVLAARLFLAEALKEAGRLVAATTNFHLAADQARRTGDSASLVNAALGYDAAQFLAGGALDQSTALLEEAKATIPADDHARNCLILIRLARAHTLLGDASKAESLNREARRLARRRDDTTSLFNLLVDRYLVPRQIASADDVKVRIAELDEIIRLAEATDDDDAKMRAHSLNTYASAEVGERARVDLSVAAIRELGEIRERLHYQWIAWHGAAMLAILEGDLLAAETLAGRSLEIGKQTHGEQVEGVYGLQMFSIRREQGRLIEVAPVIKRFVDENPDEATWAPGFALVAADLGYLEPARKRLKMLAETGFALPFDAKRSASLSYIAEVAAAVGDQDAAARLYELMSSYQHMTITAGIVTVCYGAASRYLGVLATTLGDFDRAEEHFEHALEMNGRMRADPWLAHTKAEYALLLRMRSRPAVGARSELLANEAWETATKLGLVRLKQRLQSKLN